MASSNPSGKSTMNQDNAAIATLGIRTQALEGRVNELSSSLNAVQTALSSEIRGISQALGAKIDERSRQPWQLYVSVLIGIFSLYAYIDNSKIGPLKEKDEDIRASLREMAGIIRTDMVPNWVHQKNWSDNDGKLKSLEASIEDRVKRIDDSSRQERAAIVDRIKRVEDQFQGAWSIRDALTTLDQRIRHFENMASKGVAPAGH